MFDLHLTTHQVAAYLDGLIGPEERVRIEVHLNTCERCLREIVEAIRHARPNPTTNGRAPPPC
jgi:anti-sigma factor RsiW